MPTPVKIITKTQASVNALKFTHRWLFKVMPNFYEEQWATMLFDYGYRFAAHFSSMFPGKEKMIEELLIKTPAQSGDTHNWFWMWWKIKFIQDDWEYINQKVYQQPVSYDLYKTYMLQSEILEQDLLNLLLSHQI